MTLTFEERLNRLGEQIFELKLKNQNHQLYHFQAETDINMDRIRHIEKCFGNDNKASGILFDPRRDLGNNCVFNFSKAWFNRDGHLLAKVF